MSRRVEIHLDPLSESLLLPLWARAVESRQRRPILEDPYAVQFISRIAYDFSQFEKKYGRVQPLWPIRAYTFDQVLRAFIAAHPQALIVNLGAGLDTTFFRVDNGQIRWYDLDLSEVIALRREFVQETERLRFISGSVLDYSWCDRVRDKGDGQLFIAAGLLMYLDEFTVRTLFDRVATHCPAAEMLFDFISPRFVKGGKYKWGLTDARLLPTLDERIVLLGQWRYYDQFPHRWGLPFRLLRPFILKWNGMAHIRFSS